MEYIRISKLQNSLNNLIYLSNECYPQKKKVLTEKLKRKIGTNLGFIFLNRYLVAWHTNLFLILTIN
jgi:hypothetical protein